MAKLYDNYRGSQATYQQQISNIVQQPADAAVLVPIGAELYVPNIVQQPTEVTKDHVAKKVEVQIPVKYLTMSWKQAGLISDTKAESEESFLDLAKDGQNLTFS